MAGGLILKPVGVKWSRRKLLIRESLCRKYRKYVNSAVHVTASLTIMEAYHTWNKEKNTHIDNQLVEGARAGRAVG